MTITDSEFTQILKNICTQQTSFDPKGWSSSNPLWGHCAVATLLAQDYFGGQIIRGSLLEDKKYKHLNSHYWNRLSNGIEIDFTKDQYSDLSFKDLQPEVREREILLKNIDTLRRYKLLKQAFNNFIG